MQRTSRVNSFFLLIRRTCLRWKPAAWVSASSFLLIVAFALSLPDTYRSRIRIVIGQVTQSGQPVRATDAHSASLASSDPRIDREIQRLTSDDVLRRVVRESHLVASPEASDPASRRRQEAALRHLQESLAIRSFQGPGIVEITYESSTSQRTADVLRNLAGVYATTHRILPIPAGSPARLQKMATANHARLAAARAELARFSRAHRTAPAPTSLNQAGLELGVAEATGQRALLRRVADLQDLDRDLRSHLAEARLVERLDAQNLSRLDSLEPTPPQLVGAPPRAFLILCGLLASLLLGAATALSLELLSDRLATRSSVEHATGIPVLAAIPPNAIAPSFQDAFPALYLAMQRPVTAFEGKLS